MLQHVQSPALAFLLAALLAAPARGDHQDNEDHPHEHAAPASQTPASQTTAAETLAHDAGVGEVEVLPTNDLSAAASKISATGASPAGSLHTTAKVSNNVGLSNDMKSALQGAKPSIAPEKPPPLEAIAKPVVTHPATGVHEPVAPANSAPQGYELEVGANNALPDSAPPIIAANPAPVPRGLPLPALLGIIGALALGAGFLVSRMTRKAP